MLKQRAYVVSLLLTLAACNDAPAAVTAAPTPVSSTASPTTSPTPSPTPSPTASHLVRLTPSPTPQPTPQPTPRPTAVRTTAPAVRRTTAVCPGLSGTSGAQVLLIVGSGSLASARMCEKRSGQWVAVRGPMRGHVGRNGVAAAGAKREGDGRTPSGTYLLGRGFGQSGNPGVRFRWTVVDGSDVWVDDAKSSLYNTWQRTPANGRWTSAEKLLQRYYALAQVIDYNTAGVPGRGSAMFLHLDHASGTAGCITLQRADLLAVFRWERSGARIVIR